MERRPGRGCETRAQVSLTWRARLPVLAEIPQRRAALVQHDAVAEVLPEGDRDGDEDADRGPGPARHARADANGHARDVLLRAVLRDVVAQADHGGDHDLPWIGGALIAAD